MTHLTFTKKKDALNTARIFTERLKEGHCILPLIDARTHRVTSYRLISFSEWIAECTELRAPLRVVEFVRY